MTETSATAVPRAEHRRASALLRGVVLAGLLLEPALVAQQGFVEAVKADGQRTTYGQAVVTRETLDEVALQQDGRERVVKSADVVRVVYGRGSEAFEAAQAALERGDAENAVNLFATAARDERPPWVAAVALIEQAEASALGRGGAERGRALLDEFVQRFGEHRRLPEVLVQRARYAAAAGALDAARADLARVEELAQANRVTPDWLVRAALVRGDLELEAGETRKATEAYAAAEQHAGHKVSQVGHRADLVPLLEAMQIEARVGAASCMLADGRIDEARRFYQNLQRSGGDDPAVQAAVTNGLAECDFRAGGRFKEAQLGFAQVAVTGAGVPEEHARALYYLARCAEELAELGKEKNGAELARMYREEVTKRHPDSRWARLAARSLP